MGCRCIKYESNFSNNDIIMEKLNNKSINMTGFTSYPSQTSIPSFFSMKPKKLHAPSTLYYYHHKSSKFLFNTNSRNHESSSDISTHKSSTLMNTYTDSSAKGYSTKTIYKLKPLLSLSQYESLKMFLLAEINEARTSPSTFKNKLYKYAKYIHQVNGTFYIKADEHNNIKLFQGMKSFEECDMFLSNQRPLYPLTLKNEFNLQFPDSNAKICDKGNYLTKALTKKTIELKEYNYIITNFHYDISIGNPELSVLLQVVDDTNSKTQRRLNIFSNITKYIGITVGHLKDGLFCFYFVFGKDFDI